MSCLVPPTTGVDVARPVDLAALRARLVAALCVEHGYADRADVRRCRPCRRRADLALAAIRRALDDADAPYVDGEES